MKQFTLCLLMISLCLGAAAQTVNLSQQVLLQGLRTSSGRGNFHAARYAADGSLLLLYDQGDGVRVLKSNATGDTILAQTLLGSAGDTGLAMTLDPAGNIYVAGTTTSSALAGTQGAAFASRADASTNSFLAKYDSNLNLIFLTFLGSGRTVVAGVAATADAVFVTGATFNPAFPVTPAGIQQSPALNSSENGFVERFSPDGATLIYATYVTGANGNTIPTNIVADSSDNAYIVGSTYATGFPTIHALQPSILGLPSGFLSKLTPSGDGFVFSTFLAGAGITGMALDPASTSLLLTGNLSLGQFPVMTVAMTMTSASYQTLLRIPVDGQSVTSSVLLVPGAQSYVSADTHGGAWIAGSLTTPLFPGPAPPDYSTGDSFLLHLTSDNMIDQTLRFGGAPVSNPNYASLTSALGAPAVTDSAVTVAGTLQATVSASLLPAQRFYMPLVLPQSSTLLPNAIRDALPGPASCNGQCSGTAAFLSTVRTKDSRASLGLSWDDMPNLIVRNLGSATATGLAITTNGFSYASNCGATLAPSNQCGIALTGSGPGTVTVSSTNAASVTESLGQNTLQPNPLALSAPELDFGIATSSSPKSQTLTVSNSSGVAQIFTSGLDGGASSAAEFTESASDCANGSAPGSHVLAANSSCHIVLTLTVSSSPANDGPINTAWKIGTRDVMLCGFAQANALNISATEIDFGTHFSLNGMAVGINLPRYLYLSNHSDIAVSHAAASLTTGAAFTVNDHCPTVIQPHSVCQMMLTYASVNSPSQDATRLALDGGLSVLLTGTTLPPTSVTGSSANPSLSVSTTNASFQTSVLVTGVSSETQTVPLKNVGSSSFALSTGISGDFNVTSGCPAQLAGGASCSLLIGFVPSQPGTRLGLLSLTAGSGFAPTYISLSGTATAILPSNNGVLDLGQTLVGEPTVRWYKILQPLPSLSASSNSGLFKLAIVPGTGSGHGTLPSSDFASSVTGPCANCWLGIQFTSQSAGLQAGILSLSTMTGGRPYVLTLTGTALPIESLVLTPLTADFGSLNVDSTSGPISFTLTNLQADASTVTIQSVTVNGEFAVVANQSGGASCTGSLLNTASCFISVSFSPTATGLRNGSLDIATSAGTIHSTLSGYGTLDPGLAISPSALDFENAPGTSSTQQTVVVSNTSISSLSLGPVTTSDPSFTATSHCTVLTAGSLCSISVSFTPQAATVAAILSIPVTVVNNGQTIATTYTVPLNGGYTSAESGLQIMPAEVNFGATVTGLVGGTRQFTINNLSGKQLQVSVHLPRQFPLAAVPACTTLAPAGSCTFSVSFLPATDGPITGTVYVMGRSTDGATSVEALTYMLGYGIGSGALEVDGLPIPYSPVSFGQVVSGQSASHTLSLTNNGTKPLTIHRISTAPPFFSTTTCGVALANGASCTVTLTYAPVYELVSGTSSAAARTDTETLICESDAASSPDMVSLSGLAAPVIVSNVSNPVALATFDLSQSSLTFANTQVGSTSAPQTIVLRNTGTTTLHVASVVVPGDFSVASTCTMLLSGDTCQITTRFTPTSVSASTVRSGAIHILSDAGVSLEFVSLLGISAAAPLTINPTSLSFGSVNVGSSGTLALFITNATAAPVLFLGYVADGDYSVASGSCPSIGSTLPAGSSCSLNITFTPSAAGARTGSLSLTTDATALPLIVGLSGTGVQLVPPSPSFALTVNGAGAATMTVASGSPAVYNLLLTPINGFVGPVALTCTPVVAAAYANCSLLASTLTLNGGALTSTATINTITTAAIRSGAGAALLLAALFWRRRQRRRWAVAVFASVAMGLFAVGCGSSSRAPIPSKIQRTPPGTYQYQVTASSTTGTVVSSTVTLNLIVQ